MIELALTESGANHIPIKGSGLGLGLDENMVPHQWRVGLGQEPNLSPVNCGIIESQSNGDLIIIFEMVKL